MSKASQKQIIPEENLPPSFRRAKPVVLPQKGYTEHTESQLVEKFTPMVVSNDAVLRELQTLSRRHRPRPLRARFEPPPNAAFVGLLGRVRGKAFGRPIGAETFWD